MKTCVGRACRIAGAVLVWPLAGTGAGCSDDFRDPSTSQPGVAASSTSGAGGGEAGGSGGGGGVGGAGAGAQGGGGSGPTTVVLITHVGDVQAAIPFVAAQDGDGDWQSLKGPGGSYAIEVTTGRFGLAYVCPSQSGNLIWASPAELPSLEVFCKGGSAPNTTTTTWSFTGADSDTHIAMSVGAFQASFANATGGSMLAPLGDWDALGLHDSPSISGAFAAKAVYLKRALTIASNGQFTADFTGPDAFVPPSQSYQIDGADPAIPLYVRVDFNTKGKATATLTARDTAAGGYVAVPASKQMPGDMHVFNVSNVGETGDEARFALRTFTDVKPIQMTLLPIPTVMVAIVDGAYPRPQATIDEVDGANCYGMLLSQSPALSWRLTATEGWLGASAKQLTMPDFGGLDGWQPEWSFVQGAQLSVEPFVAHQIGGVASLLERTKLAVDIEVTRSDKVVELFP